MADPHELQDVVKYDHPERHAVPVLSNGSAMHYAFLEGMPVVTASQTEEAKNRFAAIQEFDPKAVEACDEMSPEEARAAFLAIEERMRKGDVT